MYSKIMEAIEEELLNPWESSLRLEKVVLSSMARLDSPEASIPDINKGLGLFAPMIPGACLSKILKNLTRKSILNEVITDTDIQYTFTISILRDWIRKKINPFQVVSDNAKAIFGFIDNLTF